MMRILLFLLPLTSFAQMGPGGIAHLLQNLEKAKHATVKNPKQCEDPAAADLDEFCTDPERFVCGKTRKDFQEFRKKRKDEDFFSLWKEWTDSYDDQKDPVVQAQQEISRTAVDLIAEEFSYDRKSFNLDTFKKIIYSPSTSEERFFKLLDTYTSNWTSVANGWAAKRGKRPIMPFQLAREKFQKAQASLLKQVETLFKGPALVKAQDTIKNIRILTPEQFEQDADKVFDYNQGVYRFEKNTSTTVDPGAQDYKMLYQMACGSPAENGVLNAAFLRTGFAKDNKKTGKPVLIICPGFLEKLIIQRALGLPEDELELVMAHELGHALVDLIDTSKLRACIDQTIPNEDLDEGFVQSDLMPQWLKSKERIAKEKQARRDRILKGYTEEIKGDLFAVSFLAAKLRTLPDTRSRLNMIRQTSYLYCSQLVGDAHHPPASYRIGHVIRRNPEIDRVLGCRKKTSVPKPGCTLDGPTETKY